MEMLHFDTVAHSLVKNWLVANKRSLNDPNTDVKVPTFNNSDVPKVNGKGISLKYHKSDKGYKGYGTSDLFGILLHCFKVKGANS